MTKQAKLLLAIFMLLSGNKLVAQPVITSFTPTSGLAGTTVIIAGSNFSTTPAGNIVFFGAVKATVIASSATSITVIVPTGASNAPITVTTGNLTAYSSTPFTLTFAAGGTTDITAASFAYRTDFATATNPNGFAETDLDGDGKPDIVSANYYSNSISILRNTSTPGNLQFGLHVDSTAGNITAGACPGDLDGDGKPDIAVVNWNDNTVAVYRNSSTSGHIGFDAKLIYPVNGIAPNSVIIRDLDADGKPELITANVNSFNVSVLRNTSTPGNISFETALTFGTNLYPYNVVAIDLDGDGKPDLAAPANGANVIAILRNQGTPGIISFSPRIEFAADLAPNWIDAGDIDADGKPDLAVTNNQSTTVSVFHNESTPGNFDFGRNDFYVGDYPQQVAIGDLNSDGKPDLAVTGQHISSKLFVFQNRSIPGLVDLMTPVEYSASDFAWAVQIGDADGDGRFDIITANWLANTISVFRNLMGTTLPIILTSFNARAANENSLLTWQTLSEQNTDRFIIQHSVNGTNFSDAGDVKAAGNSNAPKTYQFTHNKPKEAVNYYRIKMVDIDQAYTYSSIAKVEFNTAKPRLYLSSNPAKGFLIVNHPSAAASSISIVDLSGRLVKRFPVTNHAESTRIDLTGISAGVYSLLWNDRSRRMLTELIVY